ncbi:MAG: DEAD/DEAH box helicase [Christensenellaceae bacterium]|jgi:non-specific serine/threonine protein kinase|nr:DEAD/DEAH box helicase [Christensenellaceae bacterium]
MQLVFTQDGYSVDDGQLTIQEIYNLAFYSTVPSDASIRFVVDIAKELIRTVRCDPDIYLTRSARAISRDSSRELLHGLPYVIGEEFVNIDWIERFYGRLSEIFNIEVTSFQGTIEEYIKSKNTALSVSGRVFFHLVETKEESYPFAFLATYSTMRDNKVQHLPLKRALDEFKDNQVELLGLLSTVSKATNSSELISDLVESGELFNPLKFEIKDAYTFLKEVEFYEECGIVCRIPNFWKKKARSSLKITIGENEPSYVGSKALLSFSPHVYLGDVELSREELEILLLEANGLAFLKGKWVEVNQDRIRKLLEVLDDVGDKDDLTFIDAIKMQAGVSSITQSLDNTDFQLTNGDWLESVFAKMLKPDSIESIAPTSNFKANLRHYQQTGLNWLSFMRKMKFGSLLADDMGLGKTIQILALLDKLKETESNTKTLLVIPASLLVNWQKESMKFAPNLKFSVIHGSNTTLELDKYDLFITTYGMVSRLNDISTNDWDLIILDEAQAIKNPGIKQTKAIKALNGKVKIAMTGTPIENRLTDLWSLFDFLNPGLLGGTKEFTSYVAKLKENPAGYSKLRAAVTPFILRRLKTDKTVISDLPEKNEIIQFSTLTKKQIALYTKLVNDLKEALESDEVSSMERRGKILGAIIKFKQVCNHPDQYSGQTLFDPKQSGKFELLADICQTIRDKHESVLVFTQFREMCAPLTNYLETIFERKGLVIHGGVTPASRGKIVEQFNSEYIPFMVLSLKAGGVGLNLTAANHVIHFDRWWNPAIENQATDRAFRIGQLKNVMVYKFITTGTIEDKIAEMITSKLALANDIITESSGESWITEMTNNELMNLFKLEI